MLDFEKIKSLAVGRWDLILRTLCPDLEHALDNAPHHVEHPLTGEGKDCFRFFENYQDTGGAVLNPDEYMADGFAVLKWALGWSFQESIQQVARVLNVDNKGQAPITALTPAKSVSKEPEVNVRAIENIARAWRETIPSDDPDAYILHSYLENRGIDPSLLPNAIRFHPRVPYYVGSELKGHFPAMVACISNLSGEIVNLHRTFLSEEGYKAKVGSPKKMMASPSHGITRGCAVQLFAHTKVLGVAEGIETALAVYSATGIPTWAAINAGNMKVLEIPIDVQHVIIWADHDAPVKKSQDQGVGMLSANALASRLLNQGVSCEIQYPCILDDQPDHVDWADVLLINGPKSIPRNRYSAHKLHVAHRNNESVSNQ